MAEFALAGIFLLFGAGFILVNMVAGSLLRPSRPTPEKLSSYECGEEPVGGAWVQFNIRFYVVALLFIVFEVEIAMMYPVGVIFRDWVARGLGPLALAEVGTFVGILLLGLVYAWRKGDLGWMTPMSKGRGKA